MGVEEEDERSGAEGIISVQRWCTHFAARAMRRGDAKE